MSDILIQCDQVGKKFARSLNKSMLYGTADVIQSMAGIHPKTERLRKDEFWAVDDVSFELKKGEVLGVVGPNGSGKTTLLRMLNGIFMPDKGCIDIKGTMSALIQVGAGFHPMLSGRENIYINGSILGMNKAEIDRKFDSIVEFAGIEEFLDAPVRNYSSGMYVRLGFAIAIHCEPDILVIDEILAVGDSSFRQRCFNRMNEIKDSGVAIVFVSHDLFSVSKFCTRAMFLHKGNIQYAGETHETIRAYQKLVSQILDQNPAKGVIPGVPDCTNEAEVLNVKYVGADGQEKNEFAPGEKIGFSVDFKTKSKVENPIAQMSLLNREGVHVAIFATHIDNICLGTLADQGTISCWVDELPLLLNTYYITFTIYDSTRSHYITYWNGLMNNQYFHVTPNRTSETMVEYTPVIDLKRSWQLNEKDLKSA